jgi:hypothetical protein
MLKQRRATPWSFDTWLSAPIHCHLMMISNIHLDDIDIARDFWRCVVKFREGLEDVTTVYEPHWWNADRAFWNRIVHGTLSLHLGEVFWDGQKNGKVPKLPKIFAVTMEQLLERVAGNYSGSKYSQTSVPE